MEKKKKIQCNTVRQESANLYDPHDKPPVFVKKKKKKMFYWNRSIYFLSHGFGVTNNSKIE